MCLGFLLLFLVFLGVGVSMDFINDIRFLFLRDFILGLLIRDYENIFNIVGEEDLFCVKGFFWWFVYVGWFLVIVIFFIVVIVMLFYGIEFGLKKFL